MSQENYEIIIHNERIWKFYKENPNIDIESSILLLVDLLENTFNKMSNISTTNINLQLLSYMKETKTEIENLKNNYKEELTLLKNEYKDDICKTIHTNYLSEYEKLNTIIKNNSDNLINSTEILLKNTIPQNQENISKEIIFQMKSFQEIMMEETKKNNTFNDFIQKFDTKYNTMIQTLQQPIFSILSNSEKSAVLNNKLQEELSDFLGKYKISSFKGQLGENRLSNILNEMYSTAEVINTTGKTSSGDFIVKRIDAPPFLVENKDYKEKVPTCEVEKFIKDIETQSITEKMHGIFLSQCSSICLKYNFEINIHNGSVLVYIHNCEYAPEKIRIAVEIIDRLSMLPELNDGDNESISKNLLDEINTEYQSFIINKENSINSLKDYYKKSLSQIEQLKLPCFEKYLSQKYAFSKTKNKFICEFCNIAEYSTSKGLSNHKRNGTCVAKNNLQCSVIEKNESFEPSIENMSLQLDENNNVLQENITPPKKIIRKTKK
jgi:hypothetical protein